MADKLTLTIHYHDGGQEVERVEFQDGEWGAAQCPVCSKGTRVKSIPIICRVDILDVVYGAIKLP